MAIPLIEARRLLDGDLSNIQATFEALGAIGAHSTNVETSNEARELLIRVLERRGEVPDRLQDLLQALIREHGLFPYLEDIEELFAADRIAYEIHRPAPIPGRDVVFHSEQAAVYQRLLGGQNVVLSAPTSFGKSLVIDAILAAKTEWANVAVVVPTIALIDEMRRRFSSFRDRYKIITHGSQRLTERNLFIMTQERMLDISELPPIEFFAIDEFYKLDPKHSDDRATQLNILFHRLEKTGAQFYLLGPNIDTLSLESSTNLRATFIRSAFTTVATEVRRVEAKKEELPYQLANLCRELGGQTIVFCSSPARTRTVAHWLLDHSVSGGSELEAAADWVGRAYHPEWLVGRALANGIGIHHGKLPRALAHHIVRLFNEGRVPYLLVTSTLIEGVNTTARNVVVLDNKIARQHYDYFTYANIRGRSGRMSHHYIGNVVVFNEPPQKSDMSVDIPVLSQTGHVKEEILMQLPWDELSESSKERLRPYYEQKVISIDTLRANRGVAPERQIDAARQLIERPEVRPALQWQTYPTAVQVKKIADLIYGLVRPSISSGTVRSAAQMAARLNILRHHKGDLRALVSQEIDRGQKPDEAVETALDFARQWAQFHIPRGISALERIGVDVLGRAEVADTRGFAGQVEGLFQAPFATVLEEYGLPLPVTIKLERYLRLETAGSLDNALDRLRAVPPNPGGLEPFEIEMLRDAQAGL